MQIETDLKRIAELSKEKAGENWGFRSFLKDCEVPERVIDRAVHILYRQVSARIDCCTCANCCREKAPLLNGDDVIKMAKGLNLSTAEMKRNYLVKNNEEEGFNFRQKPCPFLKDTRCSIYEFRPEYCLTYPTIGKNGVLKRLCSIIRDSSVCPIVFNVLELLKEEIWTMDMDECDALDDLDDF